MDYLSVLESQAFQEMTHHLSLLSVLENLVFLGYLMLHGNLNVW